MGTGDGAVERYPRPFQVIPGEQSREGEGEEQAQGGTEPVGEEHDDCVLVTPEVLAAGREGAEGVSPPGPPHGSTTPPPATVTDPPGPEEIRGITRSLLDKAQYMAAQKLQVALGRIKDEDLNPGALVKILSELEDLRLTADWTEKLEALILGKPELLGKKSLPPLMAKLHGMAQAARRVAAGDGREGKTKGKGPRALPQDD